MKSLACTDLPLSIIDMVETLDEFHGAGTGLRVALKLIANYGGRDIKFPNVPSDDHPVVSALGMDDARALCQFLGGKQIYVPHNRPRKSYRDAVRAMQDEGRNRAEIALALGLSERYIRMIANKPPPPSLPLFPDED